MCGIVGYIGNRQSAPILLDGLSKLEYRGYDSAGLAVRDDSGKISVVKAKGKLKELVDKTDGGNAMIGSCGIGHTRWATHGEPSETNAHPHISANSDVVVVHNGIIENYQELKEKLIHKGYTFYSDTDTEVAANLIDYYLKKYKVGAQDAIAHSMVRIRGSYALAVIFKDYPGEIWVARKDSPMIIGVNENETFIASDVPAILKYTRSVYYIGNHEIARLKAGDVTFYDLNGDEIHNKTLTEITWDAEAAEKGGYEHFMMKEIHEQPRAVRDTLNSLLRDGNIQLNDTGVTDDILRDIRSIYIIACGSAMHVGLVSQYVIEDLTHIPVRVEMASEFRYRNPRLSTDTLVIVISQSGETADTLAALRESQRQGARVLAVVNVVGSTIAREADNVLYTLAGPEIAVATTKAYSAQLMAMYCIAVKLAYTRGEIDDEKYSYYIDELTAIPDKIKTVTEMRERLQWFSSKFSNSHDIFFIGRGLDYAICMEGSLKLKEISYIHSEAYAAGELKHGTISLIEDNTLVIGVLTQKSLYEKTVSNLVECKARGAYLMGLTSNGNFSLEDSADFTAYIPKTDEHFAASVAIVPLQLIAYYISVARGLDVDKPRNLAKSVTVE